MFSYLIIDYATRHMQDWHPFPVLYSFEHWHARVDSIEHAIAQPHPHEHAIVSTRIR